MHFQRRSSSLVIISLLLPLLGIAEPVKVGVILPLSGKGAPAGEALHRGLQMVEDDNPGIVQFVFEDTALDNPRSISALRRFLAKDSISGIIVYASGPSATLAPIAEAASLPMVGLSVDPSVPRGRQFVMTFWPPSDEFARIFTSTLQQRGYRRVAVFTTQSSGILDLASAFGQASKAAGIETVYSAEYLPDETDFASAITAMKRRSPDVVFVNLYYGQAGKFAAQARSLGVTAPFGSHFIFDDEFEIVSSHGALEGAFFVTIASGDGFFHQEFQKKYHRRPTLGAIEGYDIGGIFISIIRQGKRSREEINTALHSLVRYPGRSGEISARADGKFAVPSAPYQIVDGVPVPWERERNQPEL